MKSSSLTRWVALIVIALAAALVGALGAQNRSLEQRMVEVVRRAAEPRPGIFVPEINATTIAGDPIVVAGGMEPGEHQVLAFFTTTCPYCRASMPSWKDLAARLAEDRTSKFIGIAVDSAHLAQAYVSEHGLAFPVVVLNHPKYVQFFRVRGVPEILVLRHDGQVAFARIGIMESAAAIDSVIDAVRRVPVTPPDVAVQDSRQTP